MTGDILSVAMSVLTGTGLAALAVMVAVVIAFRDFPRR